MNTNNLIQFRIPFDSDLWHKFRTIGITEEEGKSIGGKAYAGGVGASEIGNLLGLTKKYRPCPQELYHFKVGDSTPTQTPSRNMLRGKILEPIVKDIWTLWQDENDSWVLSYEDYINGDRALKDRLSIRKARKFNAYFVNSDYPWLFSSLDYFAEKNTPNIIDGAVMKEGFPLEIKTINQNYAKLWEAGVPPYHVCQLMQEMICTNSEYGEIAVLFPDDFSFRIFPFYRDDNLCKQILTYSKQWWERVLEAREALKQRDRFYREGKSNEAEHCQAIIDSNEPEPEDSEAYNEYIKERYKQVIPSVSGDMELYESCMEDEVARIYANLIGDKRTFIQNKLMKVLEMSGAEEINFDALGKVTYLPNKNGVRSLRFSLKTINPPKELAEQEFKKLNFKLI